MHYAASLLDVEGSLRTWVCLPSHGPSISAAMKTTHQNGE